jgi:hypothetical protein
MPGFRGINGASPRAWGPLHLFHDPALRARSPCGPTGAGTRLCNGRWNMARSKVGPPQRLSRDQIRFVMRWHRQAVRFHRAQGTLASLAAALNLSVHQLRRALTGNLRGLALSAKNKREIKLWEARRRQFNAQHPTARSLAVTLNVSRSTLFLCLQNKGAYRSTPGRAAGPKRGRSQTDENRMRCALIASWGRVGMSHRRSS